MHFVVYFKDTTNENIIYLTCNFDALSQMNTLIKIIQYFINSITEFKDCRQMRQ